MNTNTKNQYLQSRLAWVILSIGLILRSIQYIANRSLWLDEAMLAINLVKRSFAQLLEPLEYNQAAPVLFLWIERFFVALFGGQDFVLRLFPFLCGLVSLVLVYFFVQRFSLGISRWLILVWFAISFSLIWYSSEVKQYSTDVAVNLLLWILAWQQLESRRPIRSLVGLLLAGMAGIWLSHPALFTLFGVVAGFIFKHIQNRLQPRRATNDPTSLDADSASSTAPMPWIQLAILCIGWLMSFLIFYKISLAGLSANTVLRDSWLHAYMPLPPWANLSWFPSALYYIMQHPLGLQDKITALLCGLLLITGAIRLSYRYPAAAAMFLSTLLVLLLASAAEKYPFEGRFLLFYLPVLMLYVADGVEAVARLFHGKLQKLAAVLLMVGLLFFPVLKAVRNALNPDMGDHIKPVIAYVQNQKLEQDVVYVYYGAKPVFLFYSEAYGFKEGEYIVGIKSRRAPEAYLKELQALRGKGRVWMIFSHNCFWCQVNEREYILNNLDQWGQRIDEIQSGGASAYLYRLEQPVGN